MLRSDSQESLFLCLKFSKSPKANFMASPDLVKYFHVPEEDELCIIVVIFLIFDVYIAKIQQ
jgi:hypothetical protein